MLDRIAATITGLLLFSAAGAIAQSAAQSKEPPLANPPAAAHAAQPCCHGGERTFYTPLRNGLAWVRDHKPLRTAAGNVACGVVGRVRCCCRGR